MVRKSFAELMRESEQKQLLKQDRKFRKLEARWLGRTSPTDEYVVTSGTTVRMRDLVSRGWEVAAWPNIAHASYTLRIPRRVLEARLHG